MKNLLFLIILFFIISCGTNKDVYWCGDHPCINKKEKKAYFEKTMIVEIKDLKNKNYESDSDISKIIQETQLNETKGNNNAKDLVKQSKLEEKNLAKQIKLKEKRRIKEEKKLAKQIKLKEKKRIKDKKKSSKKKIIVNQKKQLKKVELDTSTVNTEIKLGKFEELVGIITKKNTFRPYPDINDIPN